MIAAAPTRPTLTEVVRGEFIGLVVGGVVGAGFGFVLGGYEPATLSSRLSVALVGLLFGGFVGVLVGFVAGLVLRLLRGRSLGVAVAAVWAGVALVATGLLRFLDLSPTIREAAIAAAVLGLVAGAATPWIRRTPRGVGGPALWRKEPTPTASRGETTIPERGRA